MYWYNGNLSDVLQEVFTVYKMQGEIKYLKYLFLPAYSYVCSYSLSNNWSSVHSKGIIITRLLAGFEEMRCLRVQKRRLLPKSWLVTNVSKQQTVFNLYWSYWRCILLWEKVKKKSPVHDHEVFKREDIFVLNLCKPITLCYIREALTGKVAAVDTSDFMYTDRNTDSNNIVASQSFGYLTHNPLKS